MSPSAAGGVCVYAVIGLWVVAALSNTASALLALLPRKSRAPSRPARRDVEFVIVSKASSRVLGALEETIRRVRSLFPEYKLWVIVDEGSEGIPVLRALSASPGAGFQLVVVPGWYERGAYKARALNYFIEEHVREDRWYVLLDDDSYPLDRRFLHELDEGEALVYSGVLAPRRGRSLLAWLADATRFYGDVTRSRFALRRLGKPIFGLHGDFLVVHGSVLKAIGFNTDSLAEDTWFAARLIERGVRVAQSSSLVSILSPGSVVDLWRQRGRWNVGVLRDIVKGRYPATLAFFKGLEALLWLTAPLLYFGVPLLARGGLHLLPPAARLPLALGGVLALLAYTLYPTLTMGLQGLLLSLAALPLTTLVEALSTLYSAVKLRELLSGFIVIDKSLSPAGGSLEAGHPAPTTPALYPPLHARPLGDLPRLPPLGLTSNPSSTAKPG
ncbi:hypothetical protein JCM10135_08200 [Stetteria hydrogenophila]